MDAARLLVWLGLFFVAAHAQTDVVFSRSEYVVDEETEPLGISLSAELNELAPKEDVVVTIALSTSRGGDGMASATPFGIGGQESSDFVWMAGNKFSSDPFNVTFFPGSEMSTVHKITIVPDNLYENFESFYLEITQIYAESSLRGQLRIGNTSTIRVTIIDNDVLQVRFRQTKLDVEEGQIAVLQGEIHPESNPFQRPLTVGVICFEPLTSWLQSITPAREDVDFIARGNYTLSFTDVGADPSSGLVSTTNTTVQTKDDAIVEGTESFICALRLTVSPNNPLKSADPDTITVSIIDNDMLTIRWTKPVYIFEESMNALVALEASNDFIPNFSIPGMPTEASFLLVNGVMYGKAESGVDFESASSVHFGFSRATGRLAMNVFIIHNDDVLEDDEVFFGTFSIPPLVNAIQGKPNLTSIVIRDDDAVTVNFIHTRLYVSQSSGSVELFLKVEGKFAVPLAATIHCRATSPKSARDGTDFVGISRVVEFLPSEPPLAVTKSGPIAVALLADSAVEFTKDFVCKIANVSHHRMMVGSRMEVLITIVDTDDYYNCSFQLCKRKKKALCTKTDAVGGCTGKVTSCMAAYYSKDERPAPAKCSKRNKCAGLTGKRLAKCLKKWANCVKEAFKAQHRKALANPRKKRRFFKTLEYPCSG